MGIRIPGSKSRADNPQYSVQTEANSEDIVPVDGNDLAESQIETNQASLHINVATSQPIVKINSTRASRAWSRILPALILLAIILVFVFQNLGNAKIAFLMFSGTVPLALSLIIAAALGGLLVLAIGSIRILQLRKVIHGRADH